MLIMEVIKVVVPTVRPLEKSFSMILRPEIIYYQLYIMEAKSLLFMKKV